MDLKLVLESIECALSSDKHIAKVPIGIQCGHTICKTCIFAGEIKCNICHETNHIDLNTCKESIPAKSLIKVFAHELLKSIHDKYKECLDTHKENQSKFEVDLNRKISNIRDQIDTRVKLLKNQLDKLQEELNFKLNEYKNVMLNESKLENLNVCESKLKNLEEYLMNLDTKIELKLYEHQDDLINLKKSLENFKIPEYQLNFNQSMFKHEIDSLGEMILKRIGESNEELLYENKFTRSKSKNESHKLVRTQEKRNLLKQLNGIIQDGKLRDQLRSHTFQEIDLQIQPTDVCVLPDETLLVASWNNKCLCIYDSTYKQIKCVEAIRKHTFRAFSTCTNGKDTIYLSDFDNNRILMTDMNFDLFKAATVCPNLPGRPYGIRFYDDWLYVCDPNNKRIHKFNANLVLHSYYTLETRPYQIQIYNDRALVSTCTNQISFYSVSNFDCLQTFENHGGNICVVDSLFYEFVKKTCTFYVFNDQAQEIDEIQNDSFKTLLSLDDYDSMCYFNGTFVLCSRQAKKLIVLKNYLYV